MTIAQVLRLFSRSEAPAFMKRLIEDRRKAGKPYTAACVDSVSDYLTGGIELVNGIRKSVTTRLAMWNNPRIAAATEDSDFDLGQLRNRPMSVYVGISPDNIERLKPLLVLFFQQLIDQNVRSIPERDPAYRHPALLMLDEFPVLGALPHLASAFAYIAGYGLRVVMVAQSPAQLQSPHLYGPELASVILDNCGVECVFGTKNRNVAEETVSARGRPDRLGRNAESPTVLRLPAVAEAVGGAAPAPPADFAAAGSDTAAEPQAARAARRHSARAGGQTALYEDPGFCDLRPNRRRSRTKSKFRSAWTMAGRCCPQQAETRPGACSRRWGATVRIPTRTNASRSVR